MSCRVIIHSRSCFADEEKRGERWPVAADEGGLFERDATGEGGKGTEREEEGISLLPYL